MAKIRRRVARPGRPGPAESSRGARPDQAGGRSEIRTRSRRGARDHYDRPGLDSDLPPTLGGRRLFRPGDAPRASAGLWCDRPAMRRPSPLTVSFVISETMTFGKGVYIGEGAFIQAGSTGVARSAITPGSARAFSGCARSGDRRLCWLQGPGAPKSWVLPCIPVHPADLPIIQTDLEILPVVIEDWADIGVNAAILPGVTVGRAPSSARGRGHRDIPAASPRWPVFRQTSAGVISDRESKGKDDNGGRPSKIAGSVDRRRRVIGNEVARQLVAGGALSDGGGQSRQQQRANLADVVETPVS